QPRLHVLLNLTADEAASLQGKQYRVQLPLVKRVNHRVYFLAVNHRKTPLHDENVRAALSLAINREKLLDEFFRGSYGRKIHKAINSPYPANCWASDPKLRNADDKNSCDPFNPLRADTKMGKAI